MTIVSLKTESAGKLSAKDDIRRIELSDGSLFSFKNCYLPQEQFLNTGEEREISADEETAFRFASACLQAEKAAFRLIARAEQCTSGIARKLEKRKFDAACIKTVISRLTELKLLDDRRYAQLWLESRLRVSRSPRRLLSSLCAKGIDRDDAEAAMKAALDEEAEFAMLTRFAKRHLKKTGGGEQAVTRTLKYLLKSEGFSPQAIQKFLSGE